MPPFRKAYGDRPLHLLAMLGCLLVAGYAASRVIDTPSALRIAVWFVGAAVAWLATSGPTEVDNGSYHEAQDIARALGLLPPLGDEAAN